MKDDNKFKFELFGMKYHTRGINSKINRLLFFPIFLLFVGVVFVGLGFLIQYLWNISVAEIFELKEITLKQSIALLVLCKILFGFIQKGQGKECHNGKKSDEDELFDKELEELEKK